MTSVLGHITSAEFPPDYKKWDYPPPDRLFDAPVNVVVSAVNTIVSCRSLTSRVLIVINIG